MDRGAGDSRAEPAVVLCQQDVSITVDQPLLWVSPFSFIQRAFSAEVTLLMYPGHRGRRVEGQAGASRGGSTWVGGGVLFLRKVQMLSVRGQKERPWIFGLLKVRIVTETLSHHVLSILPFFYRSKIHNSQVEA